MAFMDLVSQAHMKDITSIQGCGSSGTEFYCTVNANCDHTACMAMALSSGYANNLTLPSPDF